MDFSLKFALATLGSEATGFIFKFALQTEARGQLATRFYFFIALVWNKLCSSPVLKRAQLPKIRLFLWDKVMLIVDLLSQFLNWLQTLVQQHRPTDRGP